MYSLVAVGAWQGNVERVRMWLHAVHYTRF